MHLVVTLQLESIKKEVTKKSKALEKAEEDVRPLFFKKKFACCLFQLENRADFSHTPFMRVTGCYCSITKSV